MNRPINKYSILIISLVFVLAGAGCKKQDDFLNAKPNQALATLSSLQDIQFLLNDEEVFNGSADPGLGEIASDDLFMTHDVYINVSAMEQNCFTWAKIIYDAGSDVADWSGPYNQIFNANTVLDALPKITPTAAQQTAYDQAKGTALFYRAHAYYDLVQTFAMPYDSTKASDQSGVPLRLSSDINVKLGRASEKECYDQIILDLKNALPLLPVKAAYPTKPSKNSTYALFSRIFLAMGDYSQAFVYADSCLLNFNTLQDFNKLDPTAFPVYLSYSPEEIYHSTIYPYGTLYEGYADSNLYASFSNNDLRKSIYFYFYGEGYVYNSQLDFKGNLADPVCTDEMYLTRAECYARVGDTANAMKDLNTLLLSRWTTGTFVPYTAVSADDALSQILAERRKELWLSGMRWTDLRRLNMDPRFARTLTRVVEGNTYTLPPNDPRYAMPIPDNEISTSGIPQNPR